ncbi:MAG TPA: hypothetical protein VN633_22945 [Bryobacteraceae bacterium]|nr:hypothetical protein [Bryobacteraceae bacterium]
MRSERFIGRPLDSLTLKERWHFAGYWVALEIYSPERLPLRTIEALAPSAKECANQLRSRGLDPARFEFSALPQPYVS